MGIEWISNLKRIWTWLVHLVKKIPLFGSLVHCRAKDHASAFSEFLCAILLGTMPLWLGALRIHILDVNNDQGYIEILRNVILNGELYLYCSSFIAPIFYIALTDRRGEKPFPSKLTFIISITTILMVSAFMFSIERTSNSYNVNSFTSISMMLYVFSAILFYLAIVYKNFRSFDFSQSFYEDEEDFTDRLNVTREGQ